MLGKILIEILILWVCYALYMAILVHRRGPIGGIFFYPKAMQDRAVELGLISDQELRSRRKAFILRLEGARLLGEIADLIGFREAEVQLAAGDVVQRKKFLFDLVRHGHQIFGTIPQQHALFRQGDREAVTRKQLLAQLIL